MEEQIRAINETRVEGKLTWSEVQAESGSCGSRGLQRVLVHQLDVWGLLLLSVGGVYEAEKVHNLCLLACLSSKELYHRNLPKENVNSYLMVGLVPCQV